MKAEEFLEKLKMAMPTDAELEDYGLDEQEIEQIKATFQARPRHIGEPVMDATGEIGRLIWRFDCNSLEVGLIRFDAAVTSQLGGLRFGLCEADPLLVKPDGSVVMHDHSTPGREVFHCASNPEKFLDALIIFVQIRREEQKWHGREGEAAEMCANASGKGLSRPFYQLLF